MNDLSSLESVRLLCIGDVMLDHFIEGSVERISPEAPIPVFHQRSDTRMLGGAGNVVRNLSSLGVKTTLISVVGDDRESDLLRDLFQDLGNVQSHLVTDEGRRTTEKKRYISQGHHLLRVDQETPHALSKALEDKVSELAQKALQDCDGLILSDYNKGLLTPSLTQALIRLAGIKPVFIDPKGRDYSKYRGAHFITPNKTELSMVTGMPVNDNKDIVKAASFLCKEHHLKAVLATRGGEGMSFVSEEECFHVPANAKEVYDVSGAGDTVLAVFAACYSAGYPLHFCIELANRGGGVVVGKAGTAVIHRNELLHDSKIFSLHEGENEVAKWKGKKLKVGFTNGCFDLLHPGHLSLLKFAKSKCDRLIVGVNTDYSVQRLKGPLRPIQKEEDRVQILAALEMVDGVILFSEDTPASLIETLKPDVLVKGADYTIETVVGSDFVRTYGGETFLAPLEEGKSTSSIVMRMKSDGVS